MVPVVAKVAGGLGIVAAGSCGTYMLVSSMSGKVPAVQTIHSLYSTDTTKYANKFGKDFQRHFAAVKDEGEVNKDWWEWSYKNRFKTSQTTDMSSEFSAVTKGFGTENTALNKVCDAAYDKETKTHIFPATDSDNAKKKYRTDIWKFCSVSGQVPVTLKTPTELTDNKTSWGKHLQTKLVDNLDSKNQIFWDNQQEEFGRTTATTDTFFTKRLKTTDSKTIREICGEAYALDKDATSDTSNPKPTEEDILKYCSLTRKAT